MTGARPAVSDDGRARSPSLSSGSPAAASLRGSSTYTLAVFVYRRHDPAGTATCPRCGHQQPCPARRNAAAVIGAAGDDPRDLDPRPAGGPQSESGGYPVGGRNRRGSDLGMTYDRD